MLEVYLFTTKECQSSQMMADRTFEVVKNKFIDKIRLKGRIIELNYRLCAILKVSDAPTLYCVDTKERLIGLKSEQEIENWFNKQIELANGNNRIL